MLTEKEKINKQRNLFIIDIILQEYTVLMCLKNLFVSSLKKMVGPGGLEPPTNGL